MSGSLDFTGQLIQDTYQRVAQYSGSYLYTGTGSLITDLNFTSSQAVSASYALTASYAISASYEIIKEESSSFADTASYVTPLVQDVDINGNLTLSSGGYIYGDTTSPFVRLNNTQGAYLGYGTTNYITVGGPTTIVNGTNVIRFRNNRIIAIPDTAIGISGIDDIPTARLQVRGKGTTSSTTSLRVENANASASMVVKDDGNVGIGTTTPIGKLHVSGSTSIIDNELQLGNRTGKSGVLLLKGQGGPTYSITGSDNTLSFNLTTGASKGFISFNNPIKEVSFPRNTGGTFKILSAASASMDNNEGGLLIEDQTIIFTNGKAIYISSDSTGGIIRTTSYGSTGTAGKLQFQVGGNTLNPLNPLPDTKMVLDTDGNVGIGTTTPSEKLEVAGDIAIRDTIGALNFIYSSTPTRIARLDSDNGNLRIKADINGAQASSFISFDIDNSEKSRINSNGNLLIGTTTDGARLRVKGPGTTSATTSLLVENANASASFTVRDDGRVGVGTSSPNYYFDVTPPVLNSSGYEFNLGTSNDGSNNIKYFRSSGTDITWRTNGGANLNIIAYTSSPTAHATTTYTLSNQKYWKVGAYKTDQSFRINDGTFGVADRFTIITGSYNVGIGTTSPESKLDVSGSGRFTDGLTITGSTNIYKSGSTVLNIEGSTGQLFSVTDSLTGSLFSVNTVAGLPVIEAFSDNSVNIGKFGQYAIKVTGSNVTLANILTITPQDPLPTSGVPTGSFAVSSSAPPKPYFWDGTSWNALY